VVAAFRDAKADAAVLAGMIHSGVYTIADVKRAMAAASVPVRMVW
jgi:imidazole glycerol phosphate synthase subunit HisF